MAGAKNNIFAEKITPYLSGKLEELKLKFGINSPEYNALSLQYVSSVREQDIHESDRQRHYQSDICVMYNDLPLKGVERLYRRTIIIEPSSVCAAHCRWCLRGQYPLFTLTDEEIINFTKYCGSDKVKDNLREVLITGGDPFMIPMKLALVIHALKENAPNIQIFRIASRVPIQDPARINTDLLDIISSAAPVKVEIATHINHPIELTDEAQEAYIKLSEVVENIYDQTVLLKGVNDNPETLIELYDMFRYLGIEAHYLFHCIPMRGMSHHRTTVKKGLKIVSELTSAGQFSGRSKPMFTLMTDIGKITLYHGTIIDRNANGEILLQTSYTKESFIQNNPSWVIPDSAHEDENGFLRVWYQDGKDD